MYLETLARIQSYDSGFVVTSPESIWVVIKSLKSRSYTVSEGDVIRIGRIALRVRNTGYVGDKKKVSPETNSRSPVYVEDIPKGGLGTASATTFG
jgi:hypothetical protein